MIYALSDIHGYLDLLKKRIEQILSILQKNDIIIFLGDYVDVGPQSRDTLEFLRDLQSNYPENVIVLKGNHEQWFLDFALNRGGENWLAEDGKMVTSGTFLSKEQAFECKKLFLTKGRSVYYNHLRRCIYDKHKDLLLWADELPLYFETKKQIFVHAGVDEEAEELWKVGTDEDTFLCKYPAQLGTFRKDIIAGHIGTATISGKDDFHGIFYDGVSHYYIDSTVHISGFLNVLTYNEENGKYYSLDTDGQLRPVIKYIYHV